MKSTLVLNASFEPHDVSTPRRALELVLAGKAEMIEVAEGALHSVHLEFPVPAVVKLHRYIKVPRRSVKITRRAVLARDGYRCAYCPAVADTIDHVIPRSRPGGSHSWENVVASCKRCNNKKGDRLLADLGWELRVTPYAPAGAGGRLLRAGHVDPLWTPYLTAV
jgi:5-methylcytosine-specific restriction endonuclease McrA